MSGMSSLMQLYLLTGILIFVLNFYHHAYISLYIRTSRHDSSKYSPFELLYKRKARLPVELASPSLKEVTDDSSK